MIITNKRTITTGISMNLQPLFKFDHHPYELIYVKSQQVDETGKLTG